MSWITLRLGQLIKEKWEPKVISSSVSNFSKGLSVQSPVLLFNFKIDFQRLVRYQTTVVGDKWFDKRFCLRLDDISFSYSLRPFLRLNHFHFLGLDTVFWFHDHQRLKAMYMLLKVTFQIPVQISYPIDRLWLLGSQGRSFFTSEFVYRNVR